MPEHNASSQHTLRSVLRPAPPLAPEDSLRRCLSLTRFQPLATLPVLKDGYLKGVVPQSCLLVALHMESGVEREQFLDRPVASVMEAPIATASPEMSAQEIGELCARYGLSEIVVIDAQSYCHGLVSVGDLLLPEAPQPRPARIGGMATPFGVYLTDGSLRGGVNDFALMSTGVALAIFHGLAYFSVIGIGMLLHRYMHLSSIYVLDPDYSPPTSQPWVGLVYIGISLCVFLLFLSLMRITRLAGYHAAEHQTVHAVERGERLVPEVVRRMPRPHPRCGTNLVAAVIVFSTLLQAFGYVPFLDGGLAPILAIVATLFTWRRVGTFLQEHFTTRPASDRELASGIAAAEELLHRYLNSPPSRPGFFKRIWSQGMIQIAMGMILTFLTGSLIWFAWNHFH